MNSAKFANSVRITLSVARHLGQIIPVLLVFGLVMTASMAQGQSEMWLPIYTPAGNGEIPYPNEENYSGFGASVSISGDVLAAGARYEAAGENNSGSVYLYELDPWTEQWIPANTVAGDGVIPNPDPGYYDRFGFSLEVSGDVLAVGVPAASYGIRAVGGVYLFERDPVTGQWLPANTPAGSGYIPDPELEVNDRFGNVVSVSGDVLVVGEPQDDIDGVSAAGSVYLYERNSLTGQWQPADTSGLGGNESGHIPNPNPQVGDNFGFSLSVSGDVLAVGGSYYGYDQQNSGDIVYLYERDSQTGQWQPADTSSLGGTVAGHIPNPDPDSNPLMGEGWGSDVSVSDGVLAVGAGAVVASSGGFPGTGRAYLYERDPVTGQWQIANTPSGDGSLQNPAPQANISVFGHSVTVSGDVLVVAATIAGYGKGAGTGSYFVYQRDPTTGQWLTANTPAGNGQLLNPGPQGDTFFWDWTGWKASISGDFLVVPDINQDGAGDRIFLFERSLEPDPPFSFIATAGTAVLDPDPASGMATVSLTIDEATSPSPQIAGFSMSLGHDGAVLENPTVQMSVALAALNGGSGPGFWGVNPCAEGVTIGALFDIVDPCAQVLSMAGGLEVATVSYDVTTAAASAGVPLQTSVDFVDGLCTVQGPVLNAASDCGGDSSPVPEALRIGAIIDFVAEEQFMRPDCNGDGFYDIGDAITTLGYLFNGALSIGCLAACDGNGDGVVDIGDAITGLSGLFIPGSPPIAEPFGACGFEPFTPSAGCVSYGVCP